MDSIFQHGVASGDPLQDRVMLWTRLTLPDQEDLQLAWAIAADPEFRNVVGSGTALASAEDDHTVHVDISGLYPGRQYYYRFHALGQTSPVGRTRTLPGSNTSHIRFAQVSSARFDAGYFNAYARIADRGDLDFVLHLGGYIDHAASHQPSAAGAIRSLEPPQECSGLDDYRTRYRQVRRDPDVQRLHAALPMIALISDREIAGARDEVDQGGWMERVHNALRARSEWLPLRLPDPSDPSLLYRSLHLGRLADLFLVDTCLHRDRPVPPPEMHDPNRSALGATQRKWLFDGFDRSTAAWRILGAPSVLGAIWRADLPDLARLPLLRAGMIASHRPDLAGWDGYPAERYLLLRKIRDHKLGNVVVLSGSQAALAQDLKIDPVDPAQKTIAVECAAAGVTSDDAESPWSEKELMDFLPAIKYIDLDSRGYNLVDMTPERVQVEWWCIDTVQQRGGNEQRAAAFRIESGHPALIPVQ